MNVILTGLRGTGKSSVGKVLAQRLNFAFVDTDTRIEELAGCRIATIVAQHGWEHFRALERQVVTQVAATDRHIVAAGGGTLIDAENTRLLKVRGVVVLLVCEISILQRRLALGSPATPAPGLDRRTWNTRSSSPEGRTRGRASRSPSTARATPPCGS